MIERFWKKILRRRRLSLLAIPALFLWLASLVYRVLFAIKRAFTKATVKVDVPVVCVGNITVGGTGKTPMVGFLARFLLDEGYRVGVVSSGYGRHSVESILDPGYKVQNMPASEIGDEVKLLAGMLPEAIFAIDRVKAEAARKAAASGECDVLIVDDGFQHLPLVRDLDIVTYDAGIKRSMLKPFPYGLLREPMSALKRADVIIITRAKFARDLHLLRKRLQRISPNAEHYDAKFSATDLVGSKQTRSIKYLEDKSVFLFAGIGNFRSLKRQVSALCADLDYAMELSDHQVYDHELLNRIKSLADKYDSDLILTTGKDWMKIGDFDFDREIYYLNQVVDLDPGEEKLIAYLESRLKLKKSVG